MSVISGLPAKRASQALASGTNTRHADIDSLWGFATLAVVVSDAYQYCRSGQLYGGSWLGSVLGGLDGVFGWFFVVSAFLLYAPLVRLGLTGSGAVTPRGFLIRRLLRVVPLYWLAVIVVWAYNTSNLPGDWRDLVEHLTFTQVFDSKRIFYTIGPAWLVAVMVMFYLFIAASMTATIRYCRLAKTEGSRLLTVTAPALLLILMSWGFKAWVLFVSHVPANHWSTWFGPLAWADDLGFGMLVAVVWVAADGRLLSPRVLIGTRVSAGILLVAAMALRGQSAASVVMFRELCMISFIALLVSSVFAAPDALWRRALARPFLARIGIIGYSLYIWHEPILFFLGDHGLISPTQTNFWVIAVLLLALSVPIAFVSYWVIEYPAGHLRSLFTPGGGLRDYYADDRVHLAMVGGGDKAASRPANHIRQGLRIATEAHRTETVRLMAMTAHATGEQLSAAAAAPEHDFNPLQRLIHHRLRERGWSYGEVARRGGPRSTVYTLATTRNLGRPPRPATIDALAKGLDVPVSAVRAAAAESTGLHYYDQAPDGRQDPADQERELLIASIDELTPEGRRHVAALAESLRNKAAPEPTDR